MRGARPPYPDYERMTLSAVDTPLRFDPVFCVDIERDNDPWGTQKTMNTQAFWYDDARSHEEEKMPRRIDTVAQIAEKRAQTREYLERIEREAMKLSRSELEKVFRQLWPGKL